MKRKVIKRIKNRILLVRDLLQKRMEILARRGEKIEEDYQVIDLSQSLYQYKQSLAKTTKEG